MRAYLYMNKEVTARAPYHTIIIACCNHSITYMSTSFHSEMGRDCERWFRKRAKAATKKEKRFELYDRHTEGRFMAIAELAEMKTR